MTAAVPVAITGIGCRFPGAATPDAFWDNLVAGRPSIAPISPERGLGADRLAGTVPDVDRFDRTLFAISATEAKMMDPQQRLLLEVAWEALERSGRAPASLTGAAIGVFVGISSVDWWLLQARAGAATSPYGCTGGSPAVAAGRIAHVLGLTGPAIAVDTACSSALVAVHLACESLARGECEVALACAVSLMLSPDAMASLAAMNVLAPDGRTKAFDAAADGFVRGEGAGVLVLERCVDVAGGRGIATILGSAVGHDGRTNGLAAPSRAGQVRVIRAALARAGVAAADVGMIEAHGSGTPLGDAIEIAALAEVFGACPTPLPVGLVDTNPTEVFGARPTPLPVGSVHTNLAEALGARPTPLPVGSVHTNLAEVFCARATTLPVGSVKTNIGHLEAAAGMAGLVKAALAVERGTIPPTLNLATPAPRIAWDAIPIAPVLTATDWTGGRRIAGVSAFGFSGTNAHVLVAASEAESRSPGRCGAAAHPADGSAGRGRLPAPHPSDGPAGCGHLAAARHPTDGPARHGRLSSARHPTDRAPGRPILFALTARTGSALAVRALQLREAIAAQPERLEQLGAATAQAWIGLPVRYGFVCADAAAAIAHLDGFILRPLPAPRGLVSPRVVFRFGARQLATAGGPYADALAEAVDFARPFVAAGVIPAAICAGPDDAADLIARRLGIATSPARDYDNAIVLDFGSAPVGAVRIDSARAVLEAAVHLFVAGVAIDLARFADAEPCALPTYPFERQRAWFDDA